MTFLCCVKFGQISQLVLVHLLLTLNMFLFNRISTTFYMFEGFFKLLQENTKECFWENVSWMENHNTVVSRKQCYHIAKAKRLHFLSCYPISQESFHDEIAQLKKDSVLHYCRIMWSNLQADYMPIFIEKQLQWKTNSWY